MTAVQSERTRGFASLFPWADVVAPWLLSRALVVATIVGAGSIGRGFTARGFELYDGGWYLAIARHGYGPTPISGLQSNWPFFPLLPGLMRVLHAVGLDYGVGVVLLNSLVFLVALAGVRRLVAGRLGAGPAGTAVWTLALFPASAVFSMIYPSSIFLAASVWAFVFVEERQDVAAAFVVVAATLVRPNGFVVALALVFACRSARRIVVVCGPAFLAFLMWMAYNRHATGDALAFWHGKNGWEEVNLVEFFTGWHRQAIPHVPLAIAAVAMLWFARKRLASSWIVFAVLYLAPPVLFGTVGLGRYVNECFPPFAATGTLLDARSRTVRTVVLVLLAAGLVTFTTLIVRFRLTP
jgi:hypothetical protein